MIRHPHGVTEGRAAAVPQDDCIAFPGCLGSWAVKRVRDAATRGTTPAQIRELAMSEAVAITDEDRLACERMGKYGRAELAGRDVLLTHCNTGRLATLGWGTALGVVYAKAAAGEPVRVYACEARPLLQGVGADRIAANGDTANKIGTDPLALAAATAGVPFHVAAPTSTFDPATPDGGAIVIEERPPDEVRTFAGAAAAPADVKVSNPAFDVTPHELITAFITDVGVLQPPFHALPAVPAGTIGPARTRADGEVTAPAIDTA